MSSFRDFVKQRRGAAAPRPPNALPPAPDGWSWGTVERALDYADTRDGDARVWRAQRTHAASLACGWHALPEPQRPALETWWVVGARSYCEGASARSGAFGATLRALLPAASSLEVVLIGPEMDGDWADGGATGGVRFRSVRDTLHGALQC